MENTRPSYFLFPRLTISERDLRYFSIFLPQLLTLEITRPATIPDWCIGKFQGLPAILDAELLKQTKSCIQGYRAFADLHGSSGTLGYLSQILDDTVESRLLIQEQLKGKCRIPVDSGVSRTVNAAIFLEIARELDDKRSELEKDFARADVLEQQFRDIVGISVDDETDAVADGFSTPLAQERGTPEYMLPERIRAWFRLFSLQPLSLFPVFVAAGRETMEECLEAIRAGHKGSNKDLDFSELQLGAFPRINDFGRKQYQSLVESPGAPALLESYQRALDRFLATKIGHDPDACRLEAESLGKVLEKFCGSCGTEERVSLRMVLTRGISLSEVVEILCATGDSPHGHPGKELQSGPAALLYLE